MYLKRLELQGFKTFAERTELELNAGVTAVVGPNGTGKSNISDAILWALGEQNVRELRGTKSQDVIFSGSDKRKPTGMAEVSMTFDNTSGVLPVQFSEVTITRRAFRSGDGEYFINKTACRLKDIYELFMDTGVGREAYSTISQGEMDAVLSAKPEDRRGLFEEAAGVKKYRHRRKEATRKLDNTTQNLQRVYDIVAELGDQIEPLREQSELARRYNELAVRLREIEVGLLISDLRRRSGEFEAVIEAKGGGDDNLAGFDVKIADLDSEKEQLQSKLTAMEKQIDQARAAYQELSTERQRLESLAVLMEERTRSADTAHKTLDAEIAALEVQTEETREKLARLELEAGSAGTREAELTDQIGQMLRESEELDKQIEEATRRIDEQKSSYLELAKETASRRTDAENSKHRVEELGAVLAKLTSEIDVVEKERQDTAARAKAAEKAILNLTQELAEQEKALNEARAMRAEQETALAEQTRRQTDLQRTLMEKASRLRALKEMADSHEGFFQGVRSVMASVKAGRLRGNFAVVADIISVPEGYETAVEVALGSSVQDIVAETVDDAKRAIQFLKEGNSGRATFLPLNGIKPSVSSVMGDVARSPGFLGMAGDLLDYDSKYTAAVNLLLGKVVIVDNIDSAVALRRATAGWNKIVTLDGEVIVPSGAMTGGSRASKGPNLIARKQEIDALTEDVAKLQRDFDVRAEELRTVQDSIAATDTTIQHTSQIAGQKRVSLAESQRGADFLEKEKARIDKQWEVVTLERDSAKTQLTDEEASLQAILSVLQNAGKENFDLDEVMAQAQSAVESLQAERRRLRDELLKLNVEMAGAKERKSNQTFAAKDARSLLEQSAALIEAKRAQKATTETDGAANARQRQAALTQLDEQTTVFEAASAALNELVQKRNELTEQVSATDHQLRDVNHARTELAQMIHDADVKEARLEVQLTQIKTRLLEEYEITEEEAAAWPEEIDVKYGTATEVARLRKEIREMGPVNTGAVQEYERLSERWDFLCTQKADLEAARASLNEAIKEIDEGTRDMFMQTFNQIAEAFDITFHRLFGGGSAKLFLTDPDNLLDTGIEIVVQPPGKSLQNLSLLSGGEKALTAAALLFSLMKVRPSPFCVMDEVDAALDESNVERFAELIKDYSAKTQFIVITHNRATMEAADQLYGVTMQEPGISKLISVRLAKASDEEFADGQAIVVASEKV